MENPTIEFNLPNIDGSTISLDSFPDAKGYMIVFTCNHCPYAMAYENRLIELHETYASEGVPLIAINSNDASRYPQDSLENMAVRAKKKGFEFPYLYDESQEVAHAYKAICTPHVFLVHRKDEELIVAFNGAIDDNWGNAKQVSKKYLIDAVESLLDGREIEQIYARPVGCSIKWLKKA